MNEPNIKNVLVTLPNSFRVFHAIAINVILGCAYKWEVSKILRTAACSYICNRRTGLSLVYTASRGVSLNSRSELPQKKQRVTQSGKITGKVNLYLRDKTGWNPLQILMEFLSDSEAVEDFFSRNKLLQLV